MHSQLSSNKGWAAWGLSENPVGSLFPLVTQLSLTSREPCTHLSWAITGKLIAGCWGAGLEARPDLFPSPYSSLPQLASLGIITGHGIKAMLLMGPLISIDFTPFCSLSETLLHLSGNLKHWPQVRHNK